MEVGATVTRTDCASADGVGMPPHSWSPVDPAKFQVRQGPNYAKNKRKARNAGGTFYQLQAMDWYRAGRKVDGVAGLASAAALPEAKFSHPSVPSLLVVNVQLPTEVGLEQSVRVSRSRRLLYHSVLWSLSWCTPERNLSRWYTWYSGTCGRPGPLVMPGWILQRSTSG